MYGPASTAVFRLERISKAFGGLSALSEVNLSVGQSEIAGLIGPNGAGKSTLLNAVSCVIAPRAGDILFSGRSIRHMKPEHVVALGLSHIHTGWAFSLNWVIVPLLMTILGGAGTFLGPILGAFILAGIFELANIWMPEFHPIFSGAFIVLVVLFLPDGIMGFVTGHKPLVIRRLPLFDMIVWTAKR